MVHAESCGGTPAGTGASIGVSPGATTTYFVRYSGACNTTTCASTTVTVTPLPTVSITPSTAAICEGGSITLTATGTPNNSLASVLSAINANSASLIASIPTPFAFTMDGGVNGTNISDGGLDMYDGGNSINTNLASAITYSDNTVLASASFGSGGQYFTRYVTGTASLFFWAADINGLSSMSITGNNGADGQGTQDTHTFTVTANGVTYTAFLKRVYNATDPSINQLFLVPQPNSASQTIGVTTDDSQQNINGLTGVTRVYYMLYAGASGAFINNAQATTIAQNFVNIIPTSSYSWNPGGATTSAITVSPASTTTYTVTYSSQGCSNTATREVTVNPLPVVTCGSYGPVCTDAADITLGGSPTGGTWSGTGVTGNSFDPSVGTQTLTYSYTDGNGCSASCQTTITVNPLPVVTCGSYGPVCTDAADITLAGLPVGGTWSGTGVTGNTFDPSVGTQTLTYTFTNGNGCTNSCQTTITVNPLPVVTCGTYGPVCTDAADITLGGSPSGGTWSGTGVTGNSFDPSVGTQTLTYSYTDGNGCTNSCQTTITVNPLPVVTCGTYGPVCTDAADITLTGSPSGGTWSGTGVTGNSFDPSVGTQTLTYSYTDGNGCSASCQTTITVNPLPVMTCGSYGPVCEDAADISLGGSPTGGTWSGTGVTGNSFNPSVGTQTLTYSFGPDGNGCSNSCQTTITVNPLPVVTCGSYGPVCEDAADITLSGSPAGGTWSGTGVTGNSFDPSVGTQTVTYSYTDGNGCSASCSTTITVNPLPGVTCGGPYGPVCTDAADITLGGSPSGGTWSGTGVTGNSFDPSVGTQTVTYSYTDGNGCSASCSTTITVDPLPIMSCGSYGPVCVDAADITLSGSPAGGTWSGTGVTGNSFDPERGHADLDLQLRSGWQWLLQ